MTMQKKPTQAIKNKAKADTDLSKNPKTLFPVVGVGASAGGVEASSELLKHIQPDLGMAYVFIHHLSFDHESRLTEILQRFTTMPVHKVANGMKIAANNVYVIPSNSLLSIKD